MPDTKCFMLLSKFSQPPCEAGPIIISDEKTEGLRIRGTCQDHRGGQRWSPGSEPCPHTPQAHSLSKAHEDCLLPTGPRISPVSGCAHTCTAHHGLSCSYLCTGCLSARWPPHPPVDSCSSFISCPVRPSWLPGQSWSLPFCYCRIWSLLDFYIVTIWRRWPSSPLNAEHTARLW